MISVFSAFPCDQRQKKQEKNGHQQ